MRAFVGSLGLWTVVNYVIAAALLGLGPRALAEDGRSAAASPEPLFHYRVLINSQGRYRTERAGRKK